MSGRIPWRRIVAALGLFVGVMSMVAGTVVLTGLKDAGYETHTWILVYNIALGAFSVAVAARIWRSQEGAQGGFLIAGSHLGVLSALALLWLQGDVALQSVQAMVFRSVVWVTISTLAHFYFKQDKASACFDAKRPHTQGTDTLERPSS